METGSKKSEGGSKNRANIRENSKNLKSRGVFQDFFFGIEKLFEAAEESQDGLMVGLVEQLEGEKEKRRRRKEEKSSIK